MEERVKQRERKRVKNNQSHIHPARRTVVFGETTYPEKEKEKDTIKVRNGWAPELVEREYKSSKTDSKRGSLKIVEDTPPQLPEIEFWDLKVSFSPHLLLPDHSFDDEIDGTRREKARSCFNGMERSNTESPSVATTLRRVSMIEDPRRAYRTQQKIDGSDSKPEARKYSIALWDGCGTEVMEQKQKQWAKEVNGVELSRQRSVPLERKEEEFGYSSHHELQPEVPDDRAMSIPLFPRPNIIPKSKSEDNGSMSMNIFSRPHSSNRTVTMSQLSQIPESKPLPTSHTITMEDTPLTQITASNASQVPQKISPTKMTHFTKEQVRNTRDKDNRNRISNNTPIIVARNPLQERRSSLPWLSLSMMKKDSGIGSDVSPDFERGHALGTKVVGKGKERGMKMGRWVRGKGSMGSLRDISEEKRERDRGRIGDFLRNFRR